MKKKRFHPVRFLFVLLVISLLTGCGKGLTGDPTATSGAPTLPPAQPAIVMIDGTPQVVYDERFPTPTANLDEANPVRLVELKFIQHGTRVSLFAKMQNTIEDAIAKDVIFEITARDYDGNRLHQETSLIKYIFPSEVTGLAQSFDLMPGFYVNNVELRVVSGVLDRNLKYNQPLSIRIPSLQKTETSGKFTAWLDNADPYTYTQVRLNAIAYNKNNEIIGGGNNIVDFVPHKDKMGVAIPVETLLNEDEVDRVEIYPWITQYSASLEAGKWWDTVEVKDWNFEVNGHLQFGGGAVLKNLSKHLVTDTFYIITLSDEFGRVVLSDMGYIDYMWPEEEITFAPGWQELPFTEIFPEGSSTPTPLTSETPGKPTDEQETPEKSDTPEASETPQSRGLGVMAKLLNQDPYPVDPDDPYPIETPSKPVEPTKTPQAPGTDEPPGEDPTREQQTPILQTPTLLTPTPSATPDPNRPEPIRVYPERFTVDFILVPGEFGSSVMGYNPLNASQAAFADDHTARVSVVNNLNVDLDHAVVYVLIMDETGQIVGGGRQLSLNIKSSSATEVMVPIAYLGDRDALSIKAFASLTKEALVNP